MFTGIIKQLGTVQRVEKKRGGLRLAVSYKLSATSYQPKEGASIAVNGVCLTATTVILPDVRRGGIHGVDSRLRGNDELVFDVMPETLRVTTLGSLKVGDRVNLESALKYGESLSGHLVLGHVDGVEKIVARKKQGNAVVLTVAHPRELSRYIVHKGSVAVDGVSLTVIKPKGWGSRFQVSLVSYTLHHTNLGGKRVGDCVNIEIDVLARYAL